ncbi:MAG: hypothetical protein K2Q97_06675, partial [Burkholderiaceae bacterium]|nr:hypothetical protein [Burkholderiaceae bacterium]
MEQVAQRIAHMPHVIGFDCVNEPILGWLGLPLSPEWGPDGQRKPGGTHMPGVVWSALDALAVAVALGASIELPARGASLNPVAATTTQTVNPQGVRIWR